MAGRRSFGTVRKLRSGRWQAIYTDPATRARITGPTTFLTKTDATRWLAAAETDIRRGHDLDPTGRTTTLGEYADEWLATKTSIRPATRDLYLYLLETHIRPHLGDIRLAQVSRPIVRNWNAEIRSGSLSDATAAKAYRLLRQICQAAVDDRLLSENPCRVKGAATERTSERRVPTLEEVQRLADAIEPRFRAMVLVAAFAGLRRGECFGLARRHLHLDAEPPTVHVERARTYTAKDGLVFQAPKTAAGVRTLALPGSLVTELRHHLDLWVDEDPEALLFTAQRSGDTPSKMVWRRVWDNTRSETGIDCTFHDLRHVAGTLNAVAGATLKEAMARLGHASPAAALRYQHAVRERDAEVASSVDALISKSSGSDSAQPDQA